MERFVVSGEHEPESGEGGDKVVILALETGEAGWAL